MHPLSPATAPKTPPLPASPRPVVRPGPSRRLSGSFLLALLLLGLAAGWAPALADLAPGDLRVEHMSRPEGLDALQPRLSWNVVSTSRGQRQSAYRILVADSASALRREFGNLWDSGRVTSDETLNIVYAGRPLASGQKVFWKIKVWDQNGRASGWSSPNWWTMGVLKAEDWKAAWIAHRDTAPLHSDPKKLHLPPAQHFRKDFTAPLRVRRAVLHVAALGLVEMHLNGRKVGDGWFETGWADYQRRAYTRTHDVTRMVREGSNRIGAILAEGWYAGYVGYGLLVGYGPNRTGRNFYGKTPALLAQLEIEYTDGTRQIVGTDPSWQVSADGPIREADLIMGEAFDARRDRPDWSRPGGAADWKWEPAVGAADNGSVKAMFHDTLGPREVELGFRPPATLQAYAAPPIRVTEVLPARKVTEPRPGVYIFDLGQNIAGVARLRVNAPAGTRVQLRFGEMLHADGRLMTENLRRARATDYYTCRGGGPETWTPRFTYHGFQYVEVTGLPYRPGTDAISGLVLHNDTPITGSFACSDEVMTRFWKNTLWTQRANFLEVPTDCPQRDERLGWMGDAQVYARTATYHADVAAFFTKWIDDVREAQRENGPYPDYAPYPMAHGAPGQTWGTAWTDAGVLVPWTLWMVYGDTRVLERHWESMTKFLAWRQQRAPDFRGRKDGNTWGDWLNVNETTPLEYVDQCYFARSAQAMAEMADALGRSDEARRYRRLARNVREAWARDYVGPDGTLRVPTQTAHALALWAGLAEDPGLRARLADALAARIGGNDHRMATGFLGTKALPGVLTEHGHHDLAVRLYQSRRFPSWGYEVINGATTVWERWDSYTREHGFEGATGGNNASMNSFSHYAFGAVNEWAFRHLAGIDTDGPGYHRILLQPRPPSPGSNPENTPIHWVKASYDSPRGPITTAWRRTGDRFEFELQIPANTTAAIRLPGLSRETTREGGRALERAPGVRFIRTTPGLVHLEIGSGRYRFESRLAPGSAAPSP